MKEKSRTEYTILNVFVGLGGYCLSAILGFISRMIFTRVLTAEYLGVSGLFSNILTMLSLAELGIGSAIVYALYKPLANNDKDKIASLVKFYGRCYCVVGIVVAVIGLMIMPFLNVIIREPPTIKENISIIYLIFLFNTSTSYFFSYRSSLLIAAQQNYLVTGVNYVILVIQTTLQAGWLIFRRDYIGYLIIQAAGTLIYNIIISLLAKKRYPYIAGKNIKPLPKAEKKELGRNIRALVIYKLSGLLVNSTDNLIITFFNGLTAVGLLSNYTLLSNTLNSLLNQIFNGVNASVGNLNATESKEKRMEIFSCLNFMNFWLFGWASIGIFVVSSDIVKLLFGETYILPDSIPFILAVNFYMVGMQNTIWTFKNTMGLFRYGRYLLILTAIINLTASILLGKLWGVFGILAATCISRILTNTWYDPYAVFKYGLKESPKRYLFTYFKYIIILFAVGTICFVFCSQVHFSLFWNVIIKMILCSAIANSLLWIIFRKTAEYRYLKGKILILTNTTFKERRYKI